MNVAQAARGITTNDLYVPSALDHQKPIENDWHRFKTVRAGRRGGKSRMSVRCCIKGHGPKVIRRLGERTNKFIRRARHNERVPEGYVVEPMFKGLAQGAKLIWVAPDYPQAKAIWEEELVPRFSGVYGCRVSEKDKRVYMFGAWLMLLSSENIDAARGKHVHGVVLDEAAFFKLSYAWRRVIRPTLVDLVGWAIIISTTQVGTDFNQLCKEVESKDPTRPADKWVCFNFSTSDNKRLPPEEIVAIYQEYPPGSTDAMQELEGALLDMHGDLFKTEYFKFYTEATRFAMVLGQDRIPFKEVRIYVDLAISLKEQADYFVVKIVGLSTPSQLGYYKVGVLDMFYDKLEAPAQIDKLFKLCEQWRPTVVTIESTAYQVSAVQHLRQRLGDAGLTTKVEPSYPDKDKRTRAVPWAAAMARGDVWWNQHASYMRDLMKQYLKFPNGQEGSIKIEDHDDFVDTGSLVAIDITPTTVRTTLRKVHR